MTLPSQVARPMSASTARFSAARSNRMSGKKLAGWVLLFMIVIGFAWWALADRHAPAAAALGTDDAAKLAAADAVSRQAAPPTETAPSQAPAPKASEPPAPSFTMGNRPAGEPAGSPLIAGSNTPGGPGGSGASTVGTSPRSETVGNPASAEPASSSQRPAATLGAGSQVSLLVSQGDSLLSQGKPVDARDVFNRALYDSRATEADRSVIREKLTSISDLITFSPRIEPGDAMCEAYSFQSGDRLVKLPYTKDLKTDWRLITRVNRIADPGKIGLGQRMKLVKGPFHAVVNKGAFRLDLFSNVNDSAGNRLFIRSFQVGLGAQGSTPIGSFVVKPKSKMVNPKWVNPRTGEKFDADDPKNPIGERWIGLQGTDKTTETLSGYGIHGTVDDASIGTEASMGCVRMHGPDVELVYELLWEGASTVEIRP